MYHSDLVSVSTATTARRINHKGTFILTYTVNYPVFSSDKYKAAIQRMNTHYCSKTQKYVQYIRTVLLNAAIKEYHYSINNNIPIRPFEIQQNFDVTYNRNCTISLYIDRYEYTGGAHGITIRTSDTWSVKKGCRLPLYCLFPNQLDIQGKLQKIILRQIREHINQGIADYFEDYENLVKNTFQPKNYFLTPNALAIYFQQYDIAPYVTGIPTFYIPYDEINIQLPNCFKAAT